MFTGTIDINWGSISVMIAYLILLSVIGWFLKNKVKSGNDFWSGGRNVGPVATAFSFCAAYYSTAAVIGGPAIYAQYGAGYEAVEHIGNQFVSCFLMLIILGMKMRVVSERTGSVSLPGYLAVRYESNMLRMISAVIIAVMMIPYGVSCFKGIGTAMAVVAGIPYNISIFIIAVVALIYMVTSGYFGTAMIDIIHGFFIMFGIIALGIAVISASGGVTQALDLGTSVEPLLGDIPGPLGSWPLFLSFSLIWAFTGFGQPHLVTKFFALKDSKTISIVAIISMIWCSIFAVFCTITSIGGRGLFDGQLSDWDMLTPAIAYIHGNFLIQALFLCSVVAAGLSTVASLVLSAASAIAKDLTEDGYMAAHNKTVSNRSTAALSRIVTGIVVLIMVILSINPWDMVWQLSTMASGTMGAAFVAPLTIGLYYKKATRAGALASVISGTLVTIGGYLIGLNGAIHPFMPGLIVSVILFFAVSRFTAKPSDEVIAMCFDKNWRKKTA